MYEIILTDSALRDLKGFDKGLQVRLIEKMSELENDPILKSRKLKNSSLGEYRYRVGDYRVIFDIDNGNVVILRIGHRKEIYR